MSIKRLLEFSPLKLKIGIGKVLETFLETFLGNKTQILAQLDLVQKRAISDPNAFLLNLEVPLKLL